MMRFIRVFGAAFVLVFTFGGCSQNNRDIELRKDKAKSIAATPKTYTVKWTSSSSKSRYGEGTVSTLDCGDKEQPAVTVDLVEESNSEKVLSLGISQTNTQYNKFAGLDIGDRVVIEYSDTPTQKNMQ